MSGQFQTRAMFDKHSDEKEFRWWVDPPSFLISGCLTRRILPCPAKLYKMPKMQTNLERPAKIYFSIWPPVVVLFSIGLFPKTGNISGFVNGIGCICSHPLSGFVTSGETHHHSQALHNNTFLPRALILNFQTGAKCFYIIFVRQKLWRLAR